MKIETNQELSRAIEQIIDDNGIKKYGYPKKWVFQIKISIV